MTRTFAGWLLSAAAAAGADFPEMRARGVVRAVTVRHTGPAEFDASKRFHEKLLEEFAQLHRMRIERVEVPTYGDAIPALTSFRGDVIAAGLTNTEPRRRLIAFSVETFPTRMVVVTRRPRAPVTTVAQLRGERLGTEKGTSWAEAVQETGVPRERVNEALLLKDLPAALKRGAITAAVFEVHVALPALVYDPELELGMFLGPPVSLGFGVRIEDVDLLGALNAHVLDSRRSPAWNDLVAEFFGGSAPAYLRRVRAGRGPPGSHR